MKQQKLVKFNDKGIIHYGHISWERTKQVRELALDDKLLVIDAIYPQRWIIEKKNIVNVSFDEYDSFILEKFQQAKDKSDVLPAECVVGKLVKFNTIDGLSWYKIIRVNKTRVALEWRGYTSNLEPVLGYGGTMNKQRCQGLIEEDSKLERLFNDSARENHNA